MNNVLAKSDGTTLADHINDCIRVFRELRNAIPFMKEVSHLDEFWKILFIILYFHDFGKANKEFQKKLKGEKNYWEFQRHEIYSIPFIDKLVLPEEQRNLIKQLILAHHKDYKTLLSYYITAEDMILEYDMKWRGKRDYNKKFHPRNYISNLHHNMNYNYLNNLIHAFPGCYSSYFEESIIKTQTIKISDQQNPIQSIVKRFSQNTISMDSKNYWVNMILWGATKICDHYASAGIKKIYTLKPSDFTFLDELENKLTAQGKDFHTHQKESFSIQGNAILIAPTGSGKTEAALGWLKKQLEAGQRRAFYVLPYVASINAMFKRLKRNFKMNTTDTRKLVGLQHGKLLHFLTSYNKNFTRNKSKKIRKLRDQYKSIICPLKVVTPFQLLKFCYGVKGFESGFSQLAGSCIIFDEIHAYDEITFAQIIVSLYFFVTYLRCNVFIMTATLPSFLLKEITDVIHPEKIITSRRKLLKSFNRHSVHTLKGEIQDHISLIEKYKKEDKRIIIVCNTVTRAQTIYKQLMDMYNWNKEKIVLLHSRFNSVDRFNQEEKALDNKTEILIGTQAIEVSLNIDYDVMFSEPAPLDALLQRFGRVNRGRKKGICPVYVCETGSEYDSFIYPQKIVKRTLILLKKINKLEEDKIKEYLDFVYPAWEDDQKKSFDETKQGFTHALYALQPFSRYKENEEEFYDKFDAISVLPVCLYKQYKELIDEFNFIEADKLFVLIQRRTFMYLKEENKLEQRIISLIKEEDNVDTVRIIIVKCKYLPEIGLIYEDDKKEESHDNIL